jgi:hypothetical protein
MNPHRLLLAEDLDYVLAVCALGQGLRSALEQQHNNANVFSAGEIVLCGGFNDSAGLVLLLVL